MYVAAGTGRRRARILRRLRDERGFTLIELLVATIAGLVVSAAALAIVIVSTDLTTNFSDRVNANQRGGLAMEQITQALNSSCVAAQTPPIQAGSDPNHLIFYSALSDQAAIVPDTLEVELSGSPAALTMETYAGLTGTGATGASTWTFSSTAYPTVTLLPYATNATLNGSTTPVFQYYGYDSSGNLDTNLDPSGAALTAATAAEVAEVIITFEALPSDDYNTPGRPVEFTDSVVLRLTPASSNANAPNAPCT